MGNYFKISQSWHVGGWCKWYWYLHQPSGHIFHISQGFDDLQDCLDNFQATGKEWLQYLTKDDS